MIVLVPVPWSAAAIFKVALPSGNSVTITVVGGPPSVIQRHEATPTPRFTGSLLEARATRAFVQPNASAPLRRHSRSSMLVYGSPVRG